MIPVNEERDLMLRGLNGNLESYERLREVELPNTVAPALYFNPLTVGASIDVTQRPSRRSAIRVDGAPSDLEE